MRRQADALTPLAFFVTVVSLFPLGIGPERDTLRQIALGILWVPALNCLSRATNSWLGFSRSAAYAEIDLAPVFPERAKVFPTCRRVMALPITKTKTIVSLSPR